ncbi:MAG: acyl carrier protein [Acidobacteriaceae bacterium]|jgi:D-alanine--poly(phosphoribitol) ligase subunit 2|nr:acyl carrier protein [Acidobacteriaceae bacterium]
MCHPIRTFIEEQFLIEFGDDFPEDTDLFRSGVMDSFGYVRLCRFLEQTYQFKFTEEEMTSNILVSLTRMEQFVAKKVSRGVAASG